MRVAGIDVSTHAIAVAWVELSTGRMASHDTFPIEAEKKANAFQRALAVKHAMPPAAYWADVHTIGIEDPWGRGIQSTMALYRVQGAVIAELPRDQPFRLWNPNGWKDALGCGGSASKEEVMVFVQLIEPSFAGNQDEADALGVAIATRSEAIFKERSRS